VNARAVSDRALSGGGDAELLADIAKGDRNALATLFERHHRRVHRLLARSGVSPADADDVVQATFLEVARIAHVFDGRDSCASWLCGIAMKLATRRGRSVRRLLKNLASFAQHALRSDTLHPEQIASGREELEVFSRALSKLAWKKREAFVLIEIEGFSAEEAGWALGTEPATMRTRLFHARTELRAAMRRGLR
jgi:RNA polymerase sigma-70 factor (ECF subfamily)